MHFGGKQLYYNFAKPELGYHFNVFIESVDYEIQTQSKLPTMFHITGREIML